MPAALEVDKEAVRMLVMQLGPRAAARRMGLKEVTVLQWCARGGWLEGIPRNEPLPKSMVKTPVIGLISPAEAMRNELADLNGKTRMGFARGLAKAAIHVETLDGPAILENAQNVKATIQSAATVHGWSASSPAVKVALHITGESSVAIESGEMIDAEWCDAGEVVDSQGVDTWTVAMDDAAFQ